MPWLLGLLAIFACKDDPAPAPPDTGDVPADVGCTADTDDARILALMEAIDSERVSLGATATSVALVVDGALVWCGGFGDRHPSDGGEVDGQTLFRMGSVNKMMTAVALLRQVESGAVSLDAPVTGTLPDVKMSADPRPATPTSRPTTC